MRAMGGTAAWLYAVFEQLFFKLLEYLIPVPPQNSIPAVAKSDIECTVLTTPIVTVMASFWSMISPSLFKRPFYYPLLRVQSLFIPYAMNPDISHILSSNVLLPRHYTVMVFHLVKCIIIWSHHKAKTIMFVCFDSYPYCPRLPSFNATTSVGQK
jgi:hypothetical protein